MPVKKTIDKFMAVGENYAVLHCLITTQAHYSKRQIHISRLGRSRCLSVERSTYYGLSIYSWHACRRYVYSRYSNYTVKIAT